MFRTLLIVLVSCTLATGASAQPTAEIHIPDPNLRAALEGALRKEADAPITVAEMESLTHLSASYAGIADLTGLQHAASLTSLQLYNNQIVDVTPLADLISLTELSLANNQIADVTPLAELTSLYYLNLYNNQIADVTPLADLTSLGVLELAFNQIADVTPLAELTSLTFLSLWTNRITDVTPLAGLTSLDGLDLDNNQITHVTALADLTALTSLYLRNNRIADAMPLAGLTRLGYLSLGHNEFVDVSPLTGLESLWWLGLWNNGIEDMRPLLDNAGLDAGDIVHVWRNPLNEFSRDQDIATLEGREVRVIHTGGDVPFLPIADDAQRQGFVRIVNKTPAPVDSPSLRVWIHAVDNTGDATSTYTYLRSVQSAHFNSDDLEVGNTDKDIFEAVGAGEGGWRLELYPDNPELDVEVSAYMRTRDGFLTAMNALAPATADGYRIAFFNPGSNMDQVSTLRLANPDYGTANVTIRGVDDLGLPVPHKCSLGSVMLVKSSVFVA